MSMPYPVSMITVSGEEYGAESAITLCLLLSGRWNSATAILKRKDIRDDYYVYAELYAEIENIEFERKMRDIWMFTYTYFPDLRHFSDFWLVLDDPGEIFARTIIKNTKLDPEEKVFTKKMMNRFSCPSTPFPTSENLSDESKEIFLKLNKFNWRNHPPYWDGEYGGLLKKAKSVTKLEEQHYQWFKAIENASKEWKEIIGTIQTLWS